MLKIHTYAHIHTPLFLPLILLGLSLFTGQRGKISEFGGKPGDQRLCGLNSFPSGFCEHLNTEQLCSSFYFSKGKKNKLIPKVLISIYIVFGSI